MTSVQIHQHQVRAESGLSLSKCQWTLSVNWPRYFSFIFIPLIHLQPCIKLKSCVCVHACIRFYYTDTYPIINTLEPSSSRSQYSFDMQNALTTPVISSTLRQFWLKVLAFISCFLVWMFEVPIKPTDAMNMYYSKSPPVVATGHPWWVCVLNFLPFFFSFNNSNFSNCFSKTSRWKWLVTLIFMELLTSTCSLKSLNIWHSKLQLKA